MRIGVLADVHVAQPGTPPVRWHDDLQLETAGARYSASLDRLDEEDLDAVVVLGDLAHCGDDDSLDEFLARSDRARHPVHFVAGNHDVVPDPSAVPRALARRADGRSRLLEISPTVLQDIPVTGIPITSDEQGRTFRATGVPQLEGPGVVATHFPIVSLEHRCAVDGLRYAGDLENRGELEALLGPAPVVVMAGHLHLRATAIRGPILQLSFGALVERPFDVAVLDLELDDRGGRAAVEILTGDETSPAAAAPRHRSFRVVDGTWDRTG